jgi:vacuolar-type H+-ATPase subunit E/Vma4
LDEYKKEWESKRQQESKSVNAQHKKKELTAVNSALDEIFNTKSEHERLMAELKDLETLEKETFDKN